MSSATLSTYTGDAEQRPAKNEISVWRLYPLRAGYLLIALGMGMQMWSAYMEPHQPWTLSHGIMNAMLLALVLLSALGVRYPLKMLPLLFWEMMWKSIWLLTVALPAWLNHSMDAGIADSLFPVSMVAIFYVIVPWDYVWRNFVSAKSERWW